jgi:hypothetical protein
MAIKSHTPSVCSLNVYVIPSLVETPKWHPLSSQANLPTGERNFLNSYFFHSEALFEFESDSSLFEFVS